MTYLAPPSSGLETGDLPSSEPQQLDPTHAICIATYRRPESLRVLLGQLTVLHRRPGWRIELRVVDNDEARSAAAVVNWFAQSELDAPPIRYLCEPRRNIAIARHRALDLGPAEWVVWIDDDEVPEPDWLLRLQEAADRTDADVVIGPVHARYPAAAPGWLTRGRFLDKPVPSGAEALDWTEARSCNALVRGDWLFDFNMRFNPRFGSIWRRGQRSVSQTHHGRRRLPSRSACHRDRGGAPGALYRPLAPRTPVPLRGQLRADARGHAEQPPLATPTPEGRRWHGSACSAACPRSSSDASNSRLTDSFTGLGHSAACGGASLGRMR